jgi:hypothetical protein
MALAEITEEAVRQAIGESDLLHQDAFHAKYGFAKARTYILVEKGLLGAERSGVSAPERYFVAEEFVALLRVRLCLLSF